MKISKIKNLRQRRIGLWPKKSKIHIKNQIFLLCNLILLLLVLPISAFAHESEVVHEEPVPTISPLFLVVLVAVFAIGCFLLLKFVLNNHKSSSPTASVPEKTPPAQEKTVSQNNQIESSQKNG